MSLLFVLTLIVSGFILIFIPNNNAQTANASYVFQKMWGTKGTGNGQFKFPTGVAVDSSGNVFVVDRGNDRIQKFRLASPCPTGTTQVVAGVCFVKKWGTQGTGNGQFYEPWGVAVDSSGNVFVTEYLNHRVQKFNNNGGFIRKWGTPGTGNGQFDSPTGVAVDHSGNVFVADSENDRVQKFNNNGGFIRKWGTPGTGTSQFNWTQGIGIDSSGNVFVADVYNSRVQEFTNRGDFIRMWGTNGTGPGQFRYPYGLAVDSSGKNVFATDPFSSRVQKYTSNGGFVTSWGTRGAGPGQFDFPNYLDVINTGTVVLKEYVYVTDGNNHRIQVFTWKPDVQPTTTNLNLKGSTENNNTAVTSK
jgi:tripartite motif-containing protein 71